MHDLAPSLRAALADRYEFIREIGRGGMAVVYEARDHKHNRSVAVKVLRADLSAVLGADRFLQEIEIAAGLTHPHILALHDSGECDGFLYYVMPYVDGESLRDRLAGGTTLPLEDAWEIAREVAGALAYAHRSGVIHRDIKPENILLAEGQAIVADFGIAKAVDTAGAGLTRTGFPLGTPGYMSPEQAAGGTRLDPTTDVYSLACVCYEMVVGDVPGMFVSSEASRLQRFVDAEPDHRTRLDRLPGSVEQALVRAMAMNPGDRYATPLDFAEALDPGRSGTRRYGTEEVNAIVERASELEAASPTAAGISLGGVERLAAEVGIEPAHVRQAAAALPALPAAPIPGGLLGVRGDIAFEEVVDGEISPAHYERLLEEIRMQVGEVGRINETLGRSLSWNSLSFQNSVEGAGRLIHVMIRPEQGYTTIRVTESAGQVAPVLAMVGTMLGIAGTSFVLKSLDGWAAVAGVTLVGTSCFAGVRNIFGAMVRRRHRRMRELLASLRRHIRERTRRDT